jgi:hypothetical protein
MKIKSGKKYISDQAPDLMVEVISILGIYDDYVYAEINIWHRRLDILYELCHNYKLYYDKIDHWQEVA